MKIYPEKEHGHEAKRSQATGRIKQDKRHLRQETHPAQFRGTINQHSKQLLKATENI